MKLSKFNVWQHTNHQTWNFMCHAQWRILAITKLDKQDTAGARYAAERARYYFRLATSD